MSRIWETTAISGEENSETQGGHGHHFERWCILQASCNLHPRKGKAVEKTQRTTTTTHVPFPLVEPSSPIGIPHHPRPTDPVQVTASLLHGVPNVWIAKLFLKSRLWTGLNESWNVSYLSKKIIQELEPRIKEWNKKKMFIGKENLKLDLLVEHEFRVILAVVDWIRSRLSI